MYTADHIEDPAERGACEAAVRLADEYRAKLKAGAPAEPLLALLYWSTLFADLAGTYGAAVGHGEAAAGLRTFADMLELSAPGSGSATAADFEAAFLAAGSPK